MVVLLSLLDKGGGAKERKRGKNYNLSRWDVLSRVDVR
jgi:hypothetical protein